MASYQIQKSQNGIALTYNLLTPGGLVGQLNAHTFGYAVTYTTKLIQDCNGSNDQTYGGWVVIDGSGASHPLNDFWVDRTGACFPFPSVSQTQDGSGLTVTTAFPNKITYEGYLNSGYCHV